MSLAERSKLSYNSNLALMLFEQAIRFITGFYVSIAIVRYLGVDDYGSYAIIIMIATISSVIARFGLNEILIKRFSNTDSLQLSRLITSALKLRFLISLVVFLITIIVAKYFGKNVSTTLLIISVSIVFFQSSDIIEFYYISKVNTKPIVISRNIQLVISTTLKLAVIHFDYGLTALIIIFLFESIIFYLCMCFFLKGEKLKLNSNNKDGLKDNSLCKEILFESLPIALSTLFLIILVKTDQFLVYYLLDNDSFSIYSAVVRLVESWYFIPTLIATVYFPKIIAYSSISKKKYYELLRNIYLIQLFISFLVALFMTIFSNEIISFLYGDEFKCGSKVLAILSWSGIFISLSRISSKWYINEGLRNTFLLKCILTFLLNLFLCYFLINLFGVTGAAYGMVLSLFIAEVIFFTFFKRGRHHISNLCKVSTK